jgi:hypothetical protein
MLCPRANSSSATSIMSSLHISVFAPCRLDIMLDQWLTRVGLHIPSRIPSRPSSPRIKIPYARVNRPITYPIHPSRRPDRGRLSSLPRISRKSIPRSSFEQLCVERLNEHSLEDYLGRQNYSYIHGRRLGLSWFQHFALGAIAAQLHLEQDTKPPYNAKSFHARCVACLSPRGRRNRNALRVRQCCLRPRF